MEFVYKMLAFLKLIISQKSITALNMKYIINSFLMISDMG
ncbi:hypothetical protein SAMN05216524_10782 [Mucilaginibacter sp. OK098]|nr:hypothetical protein SAMN05216524_10782 [Mucilaginibacter sp. OK098]